MVSSIKIDSRNAWTTFLKRLLVSLFVQALEVSGLLCSTLQFLKHTTQLWNTFCHQKLRVFLHQGERIWRRELCQRRCLCSDTESSVLNISTCRVERSSVPRC